MMDHNSREYTPFGLIINVQNASKQTLPNVSKTEVVNNFMYAIRDDILSTR